MTSALFWFEMHTSGKLGSRLSKVHKALALMRNRCIGDD